MSRYKPYPKYKDSGVEWLGEVPESWCLANLKLFIKTTKGLAFKASDFCDEGVSVVKASDIKNGTLKAPNVHLPESFIEVHPQVLLKENDIILSTVGSTPDVKNSAVGQIGIVPFIYAGSLLNQNTVIFRPNENFLIKTYLPFVIKSNAYREHLDLYAHGTANQASLNVEDMLNFIVPLPSVDEQKTLADFLDRETAKIDALIVKQERMIELLGEKRQALISHAVTKGLNPSIKMKDSGVEWLGEVPEHWTTKRTRYIFKVKKEIAGKLGYDVLSITQNGIKIKDTESNEGQLSMDYSKYQLVKVGDFAMNHMDLLTGYVDISRFDGVTSPDYRVFTLEDKKCCDRYFLYLFQNGYKSKIFYAFGQGSSQLGRWRFPTEAFMDFSFPYPCFKEQQAIADCLDTQTAKIDTLIQKAKKAIELLKERRTALICAAVTGKIDVRENS